MSKIKATPMTGANADHEFTSWLAITIVMIVFVAVSLLAAVWLVESGVVLPEIPYEFPIA